MRLIEQEETGHHDFHLPERGIMPLNRKGTVCNVKTGLSS